MTYILRICITLFTFFIEARISVFHVSPNFVTILVYYAGITKGELGGLFLGSIIGFIEDNISGTFLGPNLLSKGMVGYFSSFMSGSFFRWAPFLGSIGIGVFTLIDNTIAFATRSFFDQIPTTVKAAAFITFIQAVINIPFGLFIRPRNVQKPG